MKLSKNKLFITAIFLIIIVISIIVHNKRIVITTINYRNSKIPSAFTGYKILQVSDLHNAEFGKNQSTLIDKTKEIDPDIIFITGDLIDSYSTNIDISVEYVKGIATIAPMSLS